MGKRKRPTPSGGDDILEIVRMLRTTVRHLGTQSAQSLEGLQRHDELLSKLTQHVLSLHEAEQADQKAIHLLADRIATLEARLDHAQIRGGDGNQN